MSFVTEKKLSTSEITPGFRIHVENSTFKSIEVQRAKLFFPFVFVVQKTESNVRSFDSKTVKMGDLLRIFSGLTFFLDVPKEEKQNYAALIEKSGGKISALINDKVTWNNSQLPKVFSDPDQLFNPTKICYFVVPKDFASRNLQSFSW